MKFIRQVLYLIVNLSKTNKKKCFIIKIMNPKRGMVKKRGI